MFVSIRSVDAIVAKTLNRPTEKSLTEQYRFLIRMVLLTYLYQQLVLVALSQNRLGKLYSLRLYNNAYTYFSST